MIDPSVADKITPEMMQKIQELQVYNRRCEHNPLVEHTFFMRIFCRTLVLCRRWRNFWLPFRKKLIINNRLCPCIFLAPATHGKATFASIVFSANTAMPIQIFPMKNATSYPCMLSSPIGIFYFLVCKRNFHPNAYFFFCFSCIISVLYNIMSNSFIPIEYKQRLRSAARIGRDFQQCNRYDCPALSEGSSRF